MKLVIQKERKPEFDTDTYYVSTAMMEMKSVHMFIGHNKWESIQIELSDDIPMGSLRFLHLVCDDIRVSKDVEQSENTTRQLSELFPELGGKIRRAYFAGHNVMEVLPECHVY